MAVTYNLPIKEWYFDATHEGTLDYPPLFAIFELLLALIAHVLNLNTDGKLLSLTESQIRSDVAIIYQKITVILSDCVLYYAVYELCKSLESLVCQPDKPSGGASSFKNDGSNKNKDVKKGDKDDEVVKQSKGDKPTKNQQADSSPQIIKSEGQNLADAIYRPNTCTCVALLLLFQPGLLLIDHIHFQYNGFLSGIFLLSISDIVAGRILHGSFWFSILLNLKHIYLYCAPAYGMYLLTRYCMDKVEGRRQFLSFLTKAGRLGSVVVLIFVITYLPFADLDTLKQIASRLFPFKRGLTHAYWAPNLWSLYNLADKILATVYKDSLVVKFDLESISRAHKVSSTSGLVQEYEHQYLPTIRPMTTFLIVGASTLPIIIKYLLGVGKTAPRLFIKGVALTAFNSFMFGWHVHEKAIISVILPLVPICVIDQNLWPVFLRLTLAGTYSLFPLFFKPAEYLTKVSLLVAYYCYSRSLNNSYSEKHKSKLYRILDKAYLLILILNELYMMFIFGRLNHDWNPLAKLNKFEFLPLMSTSTLAASGITLSYLELYHDFLRTPSTI